MSMKKEKKKSAAVQFRCGGRSEQEKNLGLQSECVNAHQQQISDFAGDIYIPIANTLAQSQRIPTSNSAQRIYLINVTQQFKSFVT